MKISYTILSRNLGLTMHSLCKSINYLVEEGLITKDVSKQCTFLTLTEKAREILSPSCPSHYTDIQRSLLQSGAGLRILYQLLWS